MKNRRRFAAVFEGCCLMLALGVPGELSAQTPKAYVAKIGPLNAHVAGSKAHGELRLTIAGDALTFQLDAQGLPSGMMHMAHLHGFVNGKAAACPAAGADTNHDGIIDLSETEPAAGITLVPLNADPVALKIASNTYPVASETGRITYRKQVSLAALDRAVAAAFHGLAFDPGKLVVFIHGVPASASLPKTVASLPGVPAQATLPIACGKLVPAGK